MIQSSGGLPESVIRRIPPTINASLSHAGTWVYSPTFIPCTSDKTTIPYHRLFLRTACGARSLTSLTFTVSTPYLALTDVLIVDLVCLQVRGTRIETD